MSGRRVIVHAGFHKTGTTSVQDFLIRNGENIWPTTALVLPGKLRDGAARNAVSFSRSSKPGQLEDFQIEVGRVIDGLNLGKKRSLVISDENLAGGMPGRDGQSNYSAAPVLMAAMAEVIHAKIDDADLHFVFSTRNSEPWLRSTWFHNLRLSRLALDYKDYKTLYRSAAQHGGIIREVKKAVGDCPVHRIRLENVGNAHEGPAETIIDLLNIPERWRSKFVKSGVANPSPHADLADAFLDLNRSDLDDDEVVLRKKALLQTS